MAIVTVTRAVVTDPAGHAATLQYDYDDALMQLTTVRVVNGAAQPAVATVSRTSDGRQYAATFPANQTTTLPIPQDAANRIGVGLDARGRLTGVQIDSFLLI